MPTITEAPIIMTRFLGVLKQLSITYGRTRGGTVNVIIRIKMKYKSKSFFDGASTLSTISIISFKIDSAISQFFL
jgi:hypothetical protein